MEASPASDVDVWMTAITPGAPPAQALTAVCSADERRDARRFRNPLSGEEWLAARGALRLVVARAVGADPARLRFVTGPAGKPALRDHPTVHVNLSHSGQTVAVAVADRPVGIDIEAPRRLRRPDRLAARLLGADELEKWAESGEPERTTDLLRHWTRAEALLKATGRGLPGGSHRVVERLTAEGWRLRDLAIAPMVGSVAAKGDGWSVRGPHPLDPHDGEPLDPDAVVGLLAQPDRLQVVAALALGAETLDAIAAAARLTQPAARKALQRLVAARMVDARAATVDRSATYRLRAENLRATARARAARRGVPGDEREVLRNFIREDRLTSIPTSRAKRLVILDYLAARFEPGRTYPERDVNALLGAVHPDFAALRRYLVDEGFLERRDGFYWRSGGSFEVD